MKGTQALALLVRDRGPLLLLLTLWTFAASTAAFGVGDEGRPLAASFLDSHQSRLATAIFDIVQSADGRVHVAAPDVRAVLTYDGSHWQETALDCVPRDLAVDAKDRLWVACSTGAGLLHESGDFVVPAGLAALRTDLGSADWSPIALHVDGETVHFVGPSTLARLTDTGHRTETSTTSVPFGASSLFAGRLHVAREGQLLRWDDDLTVVWQLAGARLTALAPFGDSLMIAARFSEETQYYQLAPSGEVSRWSASAHHPYHVEVLQERPTGGLAIGLRKGGVLLFDASGRLESIHDRDSGLAGDFVHSLLFDDQGSLWIGLEQGVSRLSLSWPVTMLGTREGLDYPVNWVRRAGQTLIVGTSAGVLRLDPAPHPKKLRFEPLPGLEDTESWDAVSSGSDVFAATGDGIWQISEGRTSRKVEGDYLTIERLSDEHFLAHRGSDRSLVLLRRDADSLAVEKVAAAPTDFYAILAGDAEDAWLWTPDYRLYHLLWNVPGATLPPPRRVEPLDEWVDLNRVGGELRFSTFHGVYVPEPSAPGRLRPDPTLTLQGLSELGDTDGGFGLLDGPNGRAWITNYTAIRPLDDAAAPSYPFAVEATTDPWFDPLQEGIVWVGHVHGLSRIDLNRPLPALASRTSSFRIDAEPIDRRRSSRRFRFAVANYFDERNIEYQYRLKGLEETWSVWAHTTEREYPHLPAGDYEFQVRARHQGNDLGSASSAFRVDAPWYRRGDVLTLAALLLFALGALSVRHHSDRVRRRNRELRKKVSNATEIIRAKRDEALLQAEQLAKANLHLHRTVEISQKEQANHRALQERLVQLEKLEALSTLTGGVAHDFNNHLTAVVGNAQLLLMMRDSPELLEEQVEHIVNAAERAAELCDQMLQYAGQGTTVVEKIDLADTIKASAALIEAAAGHEHVLSFELDSGSHLMADPSALRQVVVSLVVNASEALSSEVTIGAPERSRTGTIAVRCGQLELSRSELAKMHFTGALIEGQYAFLEVEDNGPGIPAEIRDRVFEPFFSTKFKGRGLGLSSVYGIVQAHGGALEILPGSAGGTRVRALIPTTSESPSAPVDEKRPRLLLVDDELEVLETTQRMLEYAGYRVDVAHNGLEALKFHAKYGNEIDGIILDIAMPEINGFRVLEELRDRRPRTPVAIASGFLEAEVRANLECGDFDAFLSKPFGFSELVSVIEQLLRRERPAAKART